LQKNSTAPTTTKIRCRRSSTISQDIKHSITLEN
jgi:hypothetical protein